MIITDDFVLINFQRTGSTFAREVIRRVYEQYPGKYFVENLVPGINDAVFGGPSSQHGKVQQIPEADRAKPIVSIIRNPFDRYVSLYTYAWWKDHPQADIATLRNEFPNYPNITFREYLHMTEKFGKKNVLKDCGFDASIDIGLHSVQFIQYYCFEPLAALKTIAGNDGWCKDDIVQLLPRIHFIHTERLRMELYDFLRSLGIREECLQFIKNMDRINTSRNNSDRDFRKYYDQSLINDIIKKDRLIFELFPDYVRSLSP